MFKLDIHTHTISSGHAYSTISENARAAKERGLEILGMSDHAPTLPGAPHMFHFHNLKVLPDYIEGVRILKGVEANIIGYDGKIDMTPNETRTLDYVIASLHIPCINPSTVKDNTRAIIGAMKQPKVLVIGHPDDDRYPKDYSEIVKAAKYHDKLLEVNDNSLNPMSFRSNAKDEIIKYLEICDREQAKVICNSDAHFADHVGDFTNCKAILEEIGFPMELVVNTDSQAFMERIRSTK